MLEIKEMVLRVPGGSEQDGRVLGEDVARRVSEGLPAHGSTRELRALNLRVTAPANSTRGQMAMTIAQAILKGLA